MSSLKIVVVLVLVGYSHIVECSVLQPAAVAPAVIPAVRYAQVAPPNIHPFAAQVSTFTKGLNVFAAPYAAGVLSGPAIVPRAYAPAPYYPAPIAPALAPSPYYSAPFAPGVAPAVYPAPAPAPLYPAAPAPLLPAPFARSFHAVPPGFVPPAAPLAHAVPALTHALPSTTLLG